MATKLVIIYTFLCSQQTQQAANLEPGLLALPTAI